MLSFFLRASKGGTKGSPVVALGLTVNGILNFFLLAGRRFGRRFGCRLRFRCFPTFRRSSRQSCSLFRRCGGGCRGCAHRCSQRLLAATAPS